MVFFFGIEEASSTSPTLLAWSSSRNHKISIVELETNQEFANFEGVKLNTKNGISKLIIFTSHLINYRQSILQLLDSRERDLKHETLSFC